MEFRREHDLAFTPGQVWAVLLDFESHRQWNPYVRLELLHSDPIALRYWLRMNPHKPKLLEVPATVLAAYPERLLTIDVRPSFLLKFGRASRSPRTAPERGSFTAIVAAACLSRFGCRASGRVSRRCSARSTEGLSPISKGDIEANRADPRARISGRGSDDTNPEAAPYCRRARRSYPCTSTVIE